MPIDNQRYSLLAGVNASQLDFRSNRERLAETASVTSSASFSGSKAFGFFKPKLAPIGMSLIVGSPSSGIHELTEILKDPIILRGTQFVSDESYNSIGGASPGYMGSDKVSPFFTQLASKRSSAIIIENLSAAKASLLSDFISQIRNGKIFDKTGIIGSADVSQRQFIFTLQEEISADRLLNETSLKEHLTKIRNSYGPVLPPDLIDAAELSYLYPISDHIAECSSSLLAFAKNPTPTKLLEAISEFRLTNKEIFEISSSPIQITIADTTKILQVGGTSYKEIKTLGETNFHSFDTSLSKYYGQLDAVSAFQDALALKVQSKAKRPTSLFCVGPPGVGKTQLGKLLGEAIGGFCRIDSNVVRSTEDLFGNTYNQGLLTKSLTKGDPAVILFDEIEKMDTKAVLGTLQLIDEGRLYDAYLKETWSLSECLIVFTSNAIKDPNITENEAREVLKQRFPEEFIDRQDFIVPFRYFSIDEKRKIAEGIAESQDTLLTTEELDSVIEADSIRQIQLSIKRIQASKATKALKSGRAR